MSGEYEQHYYPDDRFPIIFHLDHFGNGKPPAVTDKLVHIESLRHPHWHEGIEILRFISGRAQVRINEDTLEATAGDMIVVNSGYLHAVVGKPTDCAVYQCLILNCDLCRSWGFELEQLVFSSHFSDSSFGHLLDSIQQEMEKEKTYYKPLVIARCMELMVLLSRECLQSKEHSDQISLKKIALMQRIMRYISLHYREPLTLETISRAMGYSAFYLSHVFSSYTGMAVMTYLQQVRMRSAQHMMSEEALSISEIAENCGYRNPSSFTAAFRKYYGKTPSEYRKGK